MSEVDAFSVPNQNIHTFPQFDRCLIFCLDHCIIDRPQKGSTSRIVPAMQRGAKCKIRLCADIHVIQMRYIPTWCRHTHDVVILSYCNACICAAHRRIHDLINIYTLIFHLYHITISPYRSCAGIQKVKKMNAEKFHDRYTNSYRFKNPGNRYAYKVL